MQRRQTANAEAAAEAQETIRRLRAEKEKWEDYAGRLVRAMVDLCPEALDAVDRDQAGASSASPRANNDGEGMTATERKWYEYAMRLLQDTVDNGGGERLTEVDRKLLKSMRRRKRMENSLLLTVNTRHGTTTSRDTATSQGMVWLNEFASWADSRINFILSRRFGRPSERVLLVKSGFFDKCRSSSNYLFPSGIEGDLV